MRKYANNRLLLIILSVYISGIISSFLIVDANIITINNGGVSIWGIIQTFTLNFWYILIMWLFGLSIIGFLFNFLIIYFRGFIYGTLIIYLLKVNFSYLLLISLIEIIIFIPIFLIISYRSIELSYNKQRLDRFGMENYYKLLFGVTIAIFIYSILLEIVGGMYGGT